ncbi:MAG: hypothetical protein AOA65_1334 [Candidatus Bathyarchaeota archaeon BA1]|nr:MAG: hypothetical protein AOA65_1334 [Candidatus Bathyarchaeota archaeon BA1]
MPCASILKDTIKRLFRGYSNIVNICILMDFETVLSNVSNPFPSYEIQSSRCLRTRNFASFMFELVDEKPEILLVIELDEFLPFLMAFPSPVEHRYYYEAV